MKPMLALFVFVIASQAHAIDLKVCLGRFHERCIERKSANKMALDVVATFAKSSAKAKTTFPKLSMCETVVTIKKGKTIEPYCLDRLGDKESRKQSRELFAKLGAR